MSYTPINWQTGDTITAEKLNRCDNGWSVGSTQLFGETVTTTVNEQDENVATLDYSDAIQEDVIIVTFDGTDYVCNRIDFNDMRFYGGFSTSPVGPDFTSYPFFIMNGASGSTLYTETAGTNTVSVSVPSVEISSNFETASIAATASAINAALPYMVEVDETPLSDIYGAIRSGRLPIIVFKSAQSSAPAYIELVIYARTYNRTVMSIRIADDGSIAVENYTADSVSDPIYPASS